MPSPRASQRGLVCAEEPPARALSGRCPGQRRVAILRDPVPAQPIPQPVEGHRRIATAATRSEPHPFTSPKPRERCDSERFRWREPSERATASLDLRLEPEPSGRTDHNPTQRTLGSASRLRSRGQPTLSPRPGPDHGGTGRSQSRGQGQCSVGRIRLPGISGPPRSCASGFVPDWNARARSSNRLSNGSAVKLRAQLNQVQAGTACTP